MAYNYSTGGGGGFSTKDAKDVFTSFIATSHPGWTRNVYTEHVGGITGSETTQELEDKTWYTDYFEFSTGGRSYYFFITVPFAGESIYVGIIKGRVPPSDTPADPVNYYGDQEGYLLRARTNDIPGPFDDYYMFAGTEGTNGYFCYCVLENSSKEFATFGIGTLDQIGNLGTGFACGTNWSHADGDAYVNIPASNRHARMFDNWSPSFATSDANHLSINQLTSEPDPEYYEMGGVRVGLGGYLGYNGPMVGDSPSTFNGNILATSCYVSVWDAVSTQETSWYRIIGIAPAFRAILIDDLQGNDVIDTDWRVYPMKSKNSTSVNSQNYGYAFKFQ